MKRCQVKGCKETALWTGIMSDGVADVCHAHSKRCIVPPTPIGNEATILPGEPGWDPDHIDLDAIAVTVTTKKGKW